MADISSLLSEMYINEQKDTDGTDDIENTTVMGIMDCSGVQERKDSIESLHKTGGLQSCTGECTA